MDYEKKYDEALRRAKAAIDIAADKDLVKGVATTIFPELRESEDERIRKSLVRLVEQFMADERKEKTLAWLKKQKKQKPFGGIYWHAIKKGEKLPCRAYVWNRDFEKYPDCWEGRLIPNLEKIHVGADTWYLPAKDVRDLPREGVDELPREQKPAEKQDYSGLTDLERSIHRGFLSAGCKKVPVTIINETAKECLAQMKPAEWDKLQEEFRNINEAFEDGKKEVVAHPEKYDLCKPAEWSEEDEKKRKFLIKGLEDRMGFGWASDPFSRESLISWLKSLRPSWKPSEEQMDALAKAVTLYGSGLDSLYQDLKKLM